MNKNQTQKNEKITNLDLVSFASFTGFVGLSAVSLVVNPAISENFLHAGVFSGTAFLASEIAGSVIKKKKQLKLLSPLENNPSNEIKNNLAKISDYSKKSIALKRNIALNIAAGVSTSAVVGYVLQTTSNLPASSVAGIGVACGVIAAFKSKSMINELGDVSKKKDDLIQKAVKNKKFAAFR